MSDIVERLKIRANCVSIAMDPVPAMDVSNHLKEAADTITRLRSELDHARRMVESLQKGIQAYLDGDWMKRFPSKLDKCSHDRFGWEDCGNCIDEYFVKLLAVASTERQDG